jgi:DNA (cytosine-5)-methyltransferase 1
MHTYGSVCSGIEAATLAWHPLGMRATWFAEIEAYPCAVLAHHYPNTPNLGDMTKLGAQVQAGKIVAPIVLVGGPPLARRSA